MPNQAASKGKKVQQCLNFLPRVDITMYLQEGVFKFVICHEITDSLRTAQVYVICAIVLLIIFYLQYIRVCIPIHREVSVLERPREIIMPNVHHCLHPLQ